MLARASPLNPRVETDNKSSIYFILLVACGTNASFISSSLIPLPLSVTRIKDLPPSFISTVTEFAFASIAFSTSSFTTAIGLSITSPAAILFIVSSSRICIDIIILHAGFGGSNSIAGQACFRKMLVLHFSKIETVIILGVRFLQP